MQQGGKDLNIHPNWGGRAPASRQAGSGGEKVLLVEETSSRGNGYKPGLVELEETTHRGGSRTGEEEHQPIDLQGRVMKI